jgi:3-hydroxyacyl-[acyl-carrier-protein] dehydratase
VLQKVIPGKYIEGYKILKKNEWFFKVHWPGDPNMPGMFKLKLWFKCHL